MSYGLELQNKDGFIAFSTDFATLGLQGIYFPNVVGPIVQTGSVFADYIVPYSGATAGALPFLQNLGGRGCAIRSMKHNPTGLLAGLVGTSGELNVSRTTFTIAASLRTILPRIKVGMNIRSYGGGSTNAVVTAYSGTSLTVSAPLIVTSTTVNQFYCPEFINTWFILAAFNLPASLAASNFPLRFFSSEYPRATSGYGIQVVNAANVVNYNSQYPALAISALYRSIDSGLVTQGPVITPLFGTLPTNPAFCNSVVGTAVPQAVDSSTGAVPSKLGVWRNGSGQLQCDPVPMTTATFGATMSAGNYITYAGSMIAVIDASRYP